MSRARFIIGDTRDVTATIADGSVDFICTSPPFLALRSYLPADHPDKHREIGSEADPAAFIDMLLGLTAEWRRVLAPHGSLAVELGDTYSGSGGAGGDYCAGGLRDGQARFDGSASRAFGTGAAPRPNRDRARNQDAWPLAKSKALIPELYRIALAYGINPLTGAPSPAGRWRVRNVVTWCRPNPPVGALGDKYRPATSDMVIACVSDRRWFDLDAVRNVNQPERMDEGASPIKGRIGGTGSDADPTYRPDRTDRPWNPAGAPPLDYWVIPPGGYSGSHYAVFPPELCRIPILSMCPREVCRTCHEPRRRIVGHAEYDRTDSDVVPARLAMSDGTRVLEKVNQHHNELGANTSVIRNAPTLGWTDCNHGDNWRPGLVLDPFGGSGTTGVVATGNARDCILIDIDPRNADLARERLGMFLDVEYA